MNADERSSDADTTSANEVCEMCFRRPRPLDREQIADVIHHSFSLVFGQESGDSRYHQAKDDTCFAAAERIAAAIEGRAS